MRRTANKIFKGRQLIVGVDLGDRCSLYYVLDESGKVILEERLAIARQVRHGGTFVLATDWTELNPAMT